MAPNWKVKNAEIPSADVTGIRTLDILFEITIYLLPRISNQARHLFLVAITN